MSALEEAQRLLDAIQQNNGELPDQSNNVTPAAQLEAMLQFARNQQRVEEAEQAVRQQQPQVDTDSLLSRLSQLNQLLASQETARGQQAVPEQQHIPTTAAASNQQQVHALLQQQMNLLQQEQVPTAVMGIADHAQQQAPSSLPFQFTSTISTTQQDLSTQDDARTAEQESADPPKRRRGRPASNSAKMHPNLVYVRRFRERQKQMENDLEATVAQRRLQLQQLQREQQQLCLKWEALEQVLLVQTNVLQLMQKLTVTDTAAHGEQQQLQLLRVQQPATSAAVDPSAENPHTPSVETQDISVHGSDDSDVSTTQQQEAAAVAAAALHAGRPAAADPDPLRDRQLLLLQAQHWLEPVRLYILRAALMLDKLGMLPANAAAAAALEAAKACPEANQPPKPLHTWQSNEAAVKAAITAAAAECGPAAAAMAAAAAASATKSVWVGSATEGDDVQQQQEQQELDGVPLVRYPYSIGMYVITPEPIKDLVWPMNMSTWQVDDGNDQQHMQEAGRALWAVVSPERWRLLRATWLTMGQQLKQVQQDFVRLHDRLRIVGAKTVVSSSSGSDNSNSSKGAAAAATGAASAATGNCSGVGIDGMSEGGSGGTRKKEHGLSLDGFASMEDSTAYEYAAAAVQVESVLMREDALSFQLCGAFLELLDPVEIAVGYVCSWPYHPQVFVIFDILFGLGEPPEQGPSGTGQS